MNIDQQNDLQIYHKAQTPAEQKGVWNLKGTGSAEQSIGSLSSSGAFLEGIKSSPVRRILSTKVENNGGLSGHQKDAAAQQQEERIRNAESGLEVIKDTLGETTESSLKEEGKTLEQMSPDELAKAVLRIRKQNIEKQKLHDEIQESRDEEAEQAQQAALNAKTTGERKNVVVHMLQKAELPVTEESVQRILTALDMAQKGKDITESTQKQLLSAEKRPTIEALYQAGHTPAGTKKTEEALNEEEVEKLFKALRPQIEEMLKESSLAVGKNAQPQAAEAGQKQPASAGDASRSPLLSADGQARYEELLADAKWLLANDLPISEENLWQLDCMKKIRGLSDAEILEEIVYSFGNGIKPEKTDLSVTIGQAKKSTEAFLEQMKGLDGKQLTEHRRLEEIRLQMTVQSGYFLMKQGIVLDISNMERIVDGLKEMENSYYKGLLLENGAQGTQEQTEQLRETVQCVEELKNAPADLLALTCVNRFSMTLTLLHTEYETMSGAEGEPLYLRGSATISQMTASLQYEAMQTQVRSDLGDSLGKAFQNVDALLEDAGMEKTQANERAVRILGRNHMEITPENITAVKAYDQQMNDLFEHFHPAVAAKMIRDGINPLDTPIYELNRQISQLREEMGIQDEEKYSSYLYRLEQNEQIGENERSAYIGLFRLLHNVKQGENAAIGQLLETGQQLTLSNLLTAVRSRKAQGFDKKLDVDFQGLTSLTYDTDSITAQLNRVYGETEADDAKTELPDYYHRMLDNILSRMDPQKVQTLLSQKEDVMSMTLEHFAEKACLDETAAASGQQRGADAYDADTPVKQGEQDADRLRQIAQQLLSHADGELRFLESLEQPATMENLNSMMELWKGNQGFYQKLFSKRLPEEKTEKLRSLAEHVLDRMEEEEGFDRAVGEFTDYAQEALQEQYSSEHLTSLDVKTLCRMNHTIQLVGNLAKERHYEIPMVLEEEIVNVSLTVLPAAHEGGKVHISIADQMEAEMTVQGTTICGYLMCAKPEQADILKGQQEELLHNLQADGYDMIRISVGVMGEERTRFIGGAGEKQAAAKQLYQLAKQTIRFVREHINK